MTPANERPPGTSQPPPAGRDARRWVLPVLLVVAGAVIAGAIVAERRAGNGEPVTADEPAPASPGKSGVDNSAPPSTSPGESAPSPTVEAPAVAEGDAAFLAMLYSLMGVSTQQESVTWLTVGNPIEADVARCMSDAGFQYTEWPSASEELASDPRSTISAEEYAAAYGFGVAAYDLGLLDPGPPDPNMAYTSSLSDGQRDAYYQTERACGAPAPDDPYRNSNAWNVALEDFRAAVDADQRTVTAMDTWRACMATAGFTFDTPMAMRTSFYQRLGGGPDRAELQQLHRDEVAAAVANVACEAAYQATYRNVITDRVNEFRGLFDAAVASGAAPDAQG